MLSLVLMKIIPLYTHIIIATIQYRIVRNTLFSLYNGSRCRELRDRLTRSHPAIGKVFTIYYALKYVLRICFRLQQCSLAHIQLTTLTHHRGIARALVEKKKKKKNDRAMRNSIASRIECVKDE